MLSRAEGESVERSKLQGCPNVLCKGKKSIEKERRGGRIYIPNLCVLYYRDLDGLHHDPLILHSSL